MRATNRKKQENGNSKLALFRGLRARLLTSQAYKNLKSKFASAKADRKAYHLVYMGGGMPIFYPKKHTVMSYRAQQRAAKKRRAAR